MTALNFPANPTNGQTYENYVYDGTDGVWKRISPGGTLGNIDDVTINAPADGESLVYDSATGDWINADATVEVYGVDTAATSYLSIPKGTNAQRPPSPSNGDIRFNTDSGTPEWYSEEYNTWINFSQVPEIEVEYLVVAGGGSGACRADRYTSEGGGGAGGYRSNVSGESSGGGAPSEPALSLVSGSYPIEIGAGGAAVTITQIGGAHSAGNSGSNSLFSSIVSIGGGGGGSYDGSTTPKVGGSGGGGGINWYSGSVRNVGADGTTGQGFPGGDPGTSSDTGAGGGGGAGAPGADSPNSSAGGAGGIGVASSITGSSSYRAGGGGGSGSPNSGNSAAGGLGGGGAGDDAGADQAGSGTINTGGGGGGKTSYDQQPATSGAGGSGVVILKMPSWASPTFSVGLTEANGGAGQTLGDYKIYTITAGTGTMTI